MRYLLLLFFAVSCSAQVASTRRVNFQLWERAGHWEFDASSGVDSSANGSDGTLNGTPTFAAGQVGANAIVLNGTTQWVDVGDVTLLEVGDADYSVSVWVNFDTTGTAEYIVAKASIAGGGWALRKTPADVIRVYNADDGETSYDALNSTTALSSATLYHIVTVYDHSARDYDIYLNGVLEAGTTTNVGSAVTTSANSDSLIIGAQSSATGGFVDGKIDDVRIYDRALTVPEIDQLYLRE